MIGFSEPLWAAEMEFHTQSAWIPNPGKCLAHVHAGMLKFTYSLAEFSFHFKIILDQPNFVLQMNLFFFSEKRQKFKNKNQNDEKKLGHVCQKWRRKIYNIQGKNGVVHIVDFVDFGFSYWNKKNVRHSGRKVCVLCVYITLTSATTLSAIRYCSKPRKSEYENSSPSSVPHIRQWCKSIDWWLAWAFLNWLRATAWNHTFVNVCVCVCVCAIKREQTNPTERIRVKDTQARLTASMAHAKLYILSVCAIQFTHFEYSRHKYILG